MNWKLPLPYIFLLSVYVLSIGVCLFEVKERSQGVTILAGSGISTVSGIITYYIVIWSLHKSNKQFYLSLSISTIVRFTVFISSIFIAYHLAQIYFLSFVLALLCTYLLFLIAEVYVLLKLKFKK